jgi:hypothetical protein
MDDTKESHSAIRKNIADAKALAAAALPLLAERVASQALSLEDPEVAGKALDRLAKLAGAMDDKGSSAKPIIHFAISASGANVRVETRTGAAQPDDEPDTVVEIEATPASIPLVEEVQPTLTPALPDHAAFDALFRDEDE